MSAEIERISYHGGGPSVAGTIVDPRCKSSFLHYSRGGEREILASAQDIELLQVEVKLASWSNLLG